MLLQSIQINENIEFVEQESGPSLSTKKALNGLRKPCLVTTGDHPLLTTNTVKLFLKNSVKENADITIGLVPHKLLLDNNILSTATPFSLSLTASSTAISSKGFIDIFTLSSSTPELSFLTLTLTL